jgi:hypothetical protein
MLSPGASLEKEARGGERGDRVALHRERGRERERESLHR